MTLRVGTRASALARIQADAVIARLRAGGVDAEAVPLSTKGDRSLGGDLSTHVGQFVTGLDARLLTGEVDLTVHSSKDVPTDLTESILQLGHLERAPAHDVLLFPSEGPDVATLQDVLLEPTSTLDAAEAFALLPQHAHLGTVSVRRQSLALHVRPDLLPVAVRGAVETRLNRLTEGRADALILAEAGLRRLFEQGGLNRTHLALKAVRLDLKTWPCAPGQGAVAVHAARDSMHDLEALRVLIDHPTTTAAVREERRMLAELGGGCLAPVGAHVEGAQAHVLVAAPDWRADVARRLAPSVHRWSGQAGAFIPPQWPTKAKVAPSGSRRLITTASSSRLTDEAALENVTVVQQHVLEFEVLPEAWPRDVVPKGTPRASWPWLLLSSPSAVRMVVHALEFCPDLARLPWAALGRGTALAALERGHTVAYCAEAEDGATFASALLDALHPDVPFLLPRSEQARPALLEGLQAGGRNVRAWTGYRTTSASHAPIPVTSDDVLLVTSPSAIEAWSGMGHEVPADVLCMGEASERALQNHPAFQQAAVHRLHGPSAEALRSWWKEHKEGPTWT